MISHKQFQFGRVACMALFMAVLSACSSSNTMDLQAYVQEVTARQTPRVEPLPEFIPYETFLYRAENLRDPFTAPSDDNATTVAKVMDNGISPESGRRKEPLEGSSLDSLRMVGTLNREADTWALVRGSNGTIHRVKPGNYLGRNHGKIVGISEHSVDVTEIVADGVGGWIERAASLALSE